MHPTLVTYSNNANSVNDVSNANDVNNANLISLLQNRQLFAKSMVDSAFVQSAFHHY